MDGFDVFGNVVLLTPKTNADAIFEQFAPEWKVQEDVVCGVSRLPNESGLIFKILGLETNTVRAKVREFWSRVRPQITGRAVPPAFAWR